MSAKRAKVFWTGRSQAIRLPKEFRFASDTCSSTGKATQSSSSPSTPGRRVTSSPSRGYRATLRGRSREDSRSESPLNEVPSRHEHLHLRAQAARSRPWPSALPEPLGDRAQRDHGGRAPHRRGQELLPGQNDAAARELPSSPDHRRVHFRRRARLCPPSVQGRACGHSHRPRRHAHCRASSSWSQTSGASSAGSPAFASRPGRARSLSE